MSSSSRGLRLRIARIGWLNLVYFVFLVACPVLTIVVFNSGMPYSIPAGLMLWVLGAGLHFVVSFVAMIVVLIRNRPEWKAGLGMVVSAVALLLSGPVLQFLLATHG